MRNNLGSAPLQNILCKKKLFFRGLIKKFSWINGSLFRIITSRKQQRQKMLFPGQYQRMVRKKKFFFSWFIKKIRGKLDRISLF